jgi:hypothetical protein
MTDKTLFPFYVGPDAQGSYNNIDIASMFIGRGGKYFRISAAEDGIEFVEGSGAGAPTDADYVVETANGSLSAEVVLGTTVITTAAHASRQAAAKAGRIFLPNNGFYVERDTGAAWTSWGPIFQCTPPVSGDFAWDNQGTATEDTTYGGSYILAPPVAGAAVSLRLRYKSAPATPYTITALLLPHINQYNYNGCGLAFRESATGKIATCSFIYSGGWKIEIDKFINSTTYSATYTSWLTKSPSFIWLKIADNGTNRTGSWSMDGKHWHEVHSIGRTDFLTADQVGYFAQSQNATYPGGITLLSWKEE